jgi:hypothetical protein
MKNTGILSLAILLATTAAGGQSSLTWSHSLNTANCPVALQATHEGLFEKKNVNDREFGPGTPGKAQPATLDQRIRLTVTNLSAHDIVSADVTAHGFSEKWRAVPLSGAEPVPDLAKQLELTLAVKGNGSASHELALPHFTTVTAIDVNAVIYADGSSWHASAPSACSVAPSMVMLVSSAE